MKRARYRRRIVPDTHAPQGIRAATIKSRRLNDGTKWHPHIDSATGAAWCDCPGYHYRRNCYHLERLRGVMQRHGEPAPLDVHACIHCHEPEAEFEVVDDAGNVVPDAHICRQCIESRTDDFDDMPPRREQMAGVA